MEFTTIIIILLLSIAVSNLLDKAFPKLPLPLIQMVCGVVLALTPVAGDLRLEPHIFMVLLVAPILFREAEEADIPALWRVRKQVVLMAFLLVFITVFAIGLAVHRLTPMVSLAAGFALGAILGPTDAIAVASISSRIFIDEKLMTTLKGEGLINDASGVISFHFAVAAMVTGSFSLVEAGGEFLLVCAGGLVVGLILIAIKNAMTERLRRAGVHSTPSFMIIEVLTPFLIYLLAEEAGVSGIIAVVVAGTRQALHVRRMERFEAELGLFKKFIWEMLIMAFNAIVFLLLGLQLPDIITEIVQSPDYTLTGTMLIALFVTAVLLGVRFLTVLLLARDVTGKGVRNTLRDSLILTLSGVKGTVSLATAFSLPLLVGALPFEQRPLLLFITAAVIIYSLILAVVLLPFIAKAPDRTPQNARYVQVLNAVVAALEREHGPHIGAVILQFKGRAQELIHEDFGQRERKDLKKLRERAMRLEVRLVQCAVAEDRMSEAERRLYFRLMSMTYRSNSRRVFKELGVRPPHPFHVLRHVVLEDRDSERHSRDRFPRERIREIFWENTDRFIRELREADDAGSEVLVSHLIDERIDMASRMLTDREDDGFLHGLMENYDRQMLKGLALEREIVARFEEEDRLTSDEADRIRLDINMMESYLLEERHESPLLHFVKAVNKRRRRRRKPATDPQDRE